MPICFDVNMIGYDIGSTPTANQTGSMEVFRKEVFDKAYRGPSEEVGTIRYRMGSEIGESKSFRIYEIPTADR